MSEAQVSIDGSFSASIGGARDLPAGYKRTEVGVIPKDWCVCQLDSLGTGRKPPVKAGPFGSSLTKAMYVSSGYKVYGQEQVIRGDPQYGDYYIARKTYLDLEACAVHPGDILMSLVGTVGKLLVVPKNAEPGIINPRLLRFSLDRNRILPLFFRYLFESEHLKTLLSRSMQGGTMGILNAGILRSVKIPVPPEQEQHAIAEAFSDVDGLLESLDALIAKKRTIKQAAMRQLLTGETRLPRFTRKWEKKQIGDVVSIRNEKILPCEVAPDTICVELEHVASGDGRLLRTTSPQDAVSSKYRFFSGDVLFGRLRPYLRKYWLADCNGICTTEIWPLVPSPGLMDSGFLLGVIQSDAFIAAANISYGTHMPRADWTVMREFDFQLPSPNEQAAIAAVLSEMNAEIAAVERRREKTLAIKQGMMQQLLTGRVRLI